MASQKLLSPKSSRRLSLSPIKEGSGRLPKPVIEKQPLVSRPVFDKPSSSDSPQNDPADKDAELARLRALLDHALAYIEGLEAINERDQAQLVLQALYGDELVAKLYEQQSQKTGKNIQLSNAEDIRIWTSDGYVQWLKDKKEADERKAAEAEQEKARKAARKSLAEEKVEWRKEATLAKKAQRARDLEEWKAEKERCKAAHIRPLPEHLRKPPRARPREPTPDHFKALEDEEDVDGDVMDEVEEDVDEVDELRRD